MMNILYACSLQLSASSSEAGSGDYQWRHDMEGLGSSERRADTDWPRSHGLGCWMRLPPIVCTPLPFLNRFLCFINLVFQYHCSWLFLLNKSVYICLRFTYIISTSYHSCSSNKQTGGHQERHLAVNQPKYRSFECGGGEYMENRVSLSCATALIQLTAVKWLTVIATGCLSCTDDVVVNHYRIAVWTNI